jgi:hypothetical protein
MDKSTTSEIRLSFSQIMPRLQLAWDSTSLGALKRCPRYYQYNIVEGYTTRGESIHLRFGIEYNDALAHYNSQRAKGLDHDQAALETVRFALNRTWDPILGRPWVSDLPMKTRETLIRSIIWYLDKFSDDPLETIILDNGQPAVEVAFRINLDISSELTGEEYLLCGYLDRVVGWNGGAWITDKKTTRYALDEKYFAAYTPNNQVSEYDFAGAIITHMPIKGVIIDAVQLGVTFSRFQRSQITRTPSQREEWIHDSMHYIRQNEEYVKNNYWPQNDATCQMYGGCPYQTVCAASPEIRPKLLEGLYVKRTWDPLVVREI